MCGAHTGPSGRPRPKRSKKGVPPHRPPGYCSKKGVPPHRPPSYCSKKGVPPHRPPVTAVRKVFPDQTADHGQQVQEVGQDALPVLCRPCTPLCTRCVCLSSLASSPVACAAWTDRAGLFHRADAGSVPGIDANCFTSG